MSGVTLYPAMCVAGTVSSHTVPPIPLERVYMQPPGLNTCLPVEPMKSVVGSQMLTTSSFEPDFTKSVMSYENGICPPSCGTSISRPLMYTIARKSACSK